MNPPNPFKTRREFLRSSVLGGALSWTVPSFVAQTFSSLNAAALNGDKTTGRDARILVVLQLAGGNDGLNTVVPHTNDDYFRARPRLALPPKELLKLNDQFALHPGLKGLKALFDDALLSVVHGVGYPNPNRSHFRSTEIWQTASDANRFEKYGWLGRYFDSACAGADPTVGISIGRQTPQAFASARPKGVSLDNPQSYRLAAMDSPGEGEMTSSEPFFKQLNQPEPALESDENDDAGATVGAVQGGTPASHSPLDYLERVALDAQLSSEKILRVSKQSTNRGEYPASPFATSLKLIARLIHGDMPTRVYYASQGGYDTHTNQLGAHDRLLKDFGDAIHAFVRDLEAQGNLDRVLVMTFSEFGRRVAENASGGTDHGAAAPLFLMGRHLKPGLIGEMPSLAPGDLVNGDLKYSTDFRSIYAGVLQDWLQTPSKPVLGRQFPPFKLG